MNQFKLMVCVVVCCFACIFSSSAFAEKGKTKMIKEEPIMAQEGTAYIPLQDIIVNPNFIHEIPENTESFNSDGSSLAMVASSATWTASGVGPNVYTKGQWYYISFVPQTYLPSGAKITSVSYSWNVQNYRSDLQVYLLNYNHSQNISWMRSGMTSTFSGDSAYCEFLLLFGVSGTAGAALNPPVYGAMDYIAVNYTY